MKEQKYWFVLKYGGTKTKSNSNAVQNMIMKTTKVSIKTKHREEKSYNR